jgi:5'-3' exonuclease
MTNLNKRIALVDADIIAYRCAASCEPSKQRAVREERFVALGRAADICNRIGSRCQADGYRFFISGTGNFRYKLYPSYKSNRVGVPKPEHLGAVQQFLVRKWGAEVVQGYEADDSIGIAADERSIICSIDKDLRQIPGEHYNFVKDVFDVVSPEAAAYNFYSLMLIGDTSDGVRGVEGVGPVKAGRMLADCTPEEMHTRVYDSYGDPERFFLNTRLLRVLRSKEEYEQILGEIDADVQCESEGPGPTEDSGEASAEVLSGVDR